MATPRKYVGIYNETNGGMTPIAKMIRDAWVFSVIEETETCEGWNAQGIDALLKKVNKEWDQHGCLVSHLPPELRERHERIHGKAIAEAKKTGWSGEFETEDDS